MTSKQDKTVWQTSVELSTKNVFEYLISQPMSVLHELFKDGWACQALFRYMVSNRSTDYSIRSLPALAKQYVLRLLFLSTPQSSTSISAWIKPEENKKHLKSLDKLLALRICEQIKGTDEKSMFKLNPTFQKQFQKTLLSVNSRESSKSEEDGDVVMERSDGVLSAEKLDNHSRERWEGILNFMISTPTLPLSETVIDLLVKTSLMELPPNRDQLVITSNGFQFLLKDTYTQLWTLLLAYVETAESREIHKKDVLAFLFQLSFLSFGKRYSRQDLTEAQLLVLRDFYEFGLVFMKKPGSKYFYPTRLAIALSSTTSIKESMSASSTTPSTTSSESYIILESNYRLYAYTTSNLQISILSLFTRFNYRMPNLAVGLINRESVRNAFSNGITATQIVNYLEQNAHIEMKKNSPVIPETITDQILLWETERNRVKFNKGMLYDTFSSDELYEKAQKYAKEIGVLMWSNRSKKIMFVLEEGHSQMRAFIKMNTPK